MLRLQIKFKLFALIAPTLNFFMLSLASLCKANCQLLILKIAATHTLDKTWVPLLFKWIFEAFRCLTVIVLPWPKNCNFFSRDLSFNSRFSSAAFSWYWSFLAVMFDIEISQFLLSLMTKLAIFSAIFQELFWWVRHSFQHGERYEWAFLSVLILLNPPYT